MWHVVSELVVGFVFVGCLLLIAGVAADVFSNNSEGENE